MAVVTGGRTDKSKVLSTPTRFFCARLHICKHRAQREREDTGTGVRTETSEALGTGGGKTSNTSRGHQILCPPSAITIR